LANTRTTLLNCCSAGIRSVDASGANDMTGTGLLHQSTAPALDRRERRSSPVSGPVPIRIGPFCSSPPALPCPA